MFFAEYKLSLTLLFDILLSQYAVSVPLRSTTTEAQTAKQIDFDLFGNNSQ